MPTTVPNRNGKDCSYMLIFQHMYVLNVPIGIVPDEKKKIWKLGRKYSTLSTVMKKSVNRTSTAEKICRCFCTSGSDAVFCMLRNTVKIKFFLQRHSPFSISPLSFSASQSILGSFPPGLK